MDYHLYLKQSLCSMIFTLKCNRTSGCLENRKLIPGYVLYGTICAGKQYEIILTCYKMTLIVRHNHTFAAKVLSKRLQKIRNPADKQSHIQQTQSRLPSSKSLDFILKSCFCPPIFTHLLYIHILFDSSLHHIHFNWQSIIYRLVLCIWLNSLLSHISGKTIVTYNFFCLVINYNIQIYGTDIRHMLSNSYQSYLYA